MGINKRFSALFAEVIGEHNRLVWLDTPLGCDVLLPHRVMSSERLGRLYEYTIDAISIRSDIELKELIARPVTLWVRGHNGSYTPIHGYVHMARRLGSEGSHTSYQLSFSPWTYFLRFRHDARIWQDKTVQDILYDVFNSHPDARGNFRFELRDKYAPRSYCTQYETDWNFAMRLMEEEGWFVRYEQTPDGSGHTVIVTDTVKLLHPLEDDSISFHHGGTGDESDKIVQWSASRKIMSSSLTTRTFDYKAPRHEKGANAQLMPGHGKIPVEMEVYQYTGAYIDSHHERANVQTKKRLEGWESAAKRFFAISGNRKVLVGRWFRLEDHAVHDHDSTADREFLVVGIEWFIENNLPFSTTQLDFPGCLKSLLDEFSEGGQQKSRNAANNAGRCFNRFEVQRRKVEFRCPLEHHKPVMHPQTAIVIGPAGQEIHTDHLNRIQVKVHWHRSGEGRGIATCWIRVCYPAAGEGWGTHNVPRIGQEVMLVYLGGDPDRPAAIGSLYNVEQLPAWHSDGMLSGTKTKEYNGTGFNQLLFDDNTQQNRVQLYSTKGNSQLSLGYLIGQHGNTRRGFYGMGFALNTDYYGGIVAGKGLYLSTFPRLGATGSQLDAREAHAQFSAAATLTETVSKTAQRAGADGFNALGSLEKFKDATRVQYENSPDGEAWRFKEPILVAASPSGVGLTSSEGIHIHAGDAVTMSSTADTNIAVGEILAIGAAEQISVFANNGGIKMVSANGKVEIEAQGDGVDIIANALLRLISTSDRIELFSKTEIVMSAGGSFIKLNKSGITQGTAGTWTAHASVHEMPGPTTFAREMNTWQKTSFDEEFIVLHQGTGEPVANRRFEITREDGTVLRGTTDEQGKTGLQKSQLMGNIRLKFLGGIPR